jgi:hypothetical protein
MVLAIVIAGCSPAVTDSPVVAPASPAAPEVTAGELVAGKAVQNVAANVALEMKIEAPAEMRVGKYATFKIALTNRTQEVITLVRPGDGSNVGWRTPLTASMIVPESAFKVAPAWPEPRGYVRCGNINSLKADEVVTLRPGESLNYTDYVQFAEPGKQVVVFYYRNVPGHPWSGLPLGAHDAVAMERVHGSTPVDVRQEAVIEVLPANDAKAARL